MEFTQLLESTWVTLAEAVLNIAGSVLILVIGWLAAIILRALITRGLGALKVNHHVQEVAGIQLDVERTAGTVVFYFVLAVAFIGFFNTLDLRQVSAPLQSMVDQVMTFIPSLVAAAVLALVAWLLAMLLGNLARKGLAQTSLDERVEHFAGTRPLSDTLSRLIRGLILLLFLPAVLDTLRLGGLLAPVQSMVEEILGMAPNIAAALILGVVGWVVARLLRDLVTDLLAATGVDAFGTKVGIRGTMSLSSLIGLVVFIFIFVPALIAALDAMKIEAVSRPSMDMLGTLMSALPQLLAAGLILTLAFLVAKLVGSILTDLLGGAGFDALPEKLGLPIELPERMTASAAAGNVVRFFIVLLAAVEASSVLGFSQVAGIVESLTALAGRVLLGSIVIVAGFWLARLVFDMVARADKPGSAMTANIVRVAVVGLAVAMGLRAMGIASEIITVAFSLIVGALAVAFALAFGLGGRETAGRQIDAWLRNLAADGSGGQGGDPGRSKQYDN